MVLGALVLTAGLKLSASRHESAATGECDAAAQTELARVARALKRLKGSLSSARSVGDDATAIVVGEPTPDRLAAGTDALLCEVEVRVRELCALGPAGASAFAALTHERERDGTRLALLNAASAATVDALGMVLSRPFEPPTSVGEILALCDAIASLEATGHEAQVLAWTRAGEASVRKMAALALAPSDPAVVLPRLVELSLFDPDSAVRGNASAVVSPEYVRSVPTELLAGTEVDVRAAHRGVLELVPPSAWGTVDVRIQEELHRRSE